MGWFTEKERENVADDLGVSPNDVAEMETRLSGQDIGFDMSADDDGDNSQLPLLAPASYLEDENSNFAKNFENRDYQTYELERLSKALQSLDERSRYIIKRRWLDDNKATLQELSDELKVSVERVRQIENASLKKIKSQILTSNSDCLALEIKNTDVTVDKETNIKKEKKSLKIKNS